MTSDLFESKPPVDVTEVPEDEKNYYEELVGEGKKFKDVESLAKSVSFKDTHIRNLETEMADLRKEFQQRLTYEELMSKIKEMSSPNQGDHINSDKIEEKKEDVIDQVNQLLDERLNQFKEGSVKERNVDQVRRRLEEVWGVNYSQKLTEKAQELNLDPSFLGGIAETNPEAFLKIVVPQEKKVTVDPAPPRSSINITSTPNNSPKYSDYRKLLTSGNPSDTRKFLSPEVQREIHQLTAKYGDDFLNN